MNTKSSWVVRNCNAANLITLAGVVLCFVLLWVIAIHKEWTLTMLFLVVGVVVSDLIDGPVARHYGTVSDFGGALDRLRDKLLLGIMFLFLILDGRVHITLKIITVPMAVVETALLVYWFKGVRRKMNVSAGVWGKVKMDLLSAGILLCLLNIIVEERWGSRYHLYATIALNLLFAFSLFFGVKSFLGHKAKYRKQLSDSDSCPDK